MDKFAIQIRNLGKSYKLYGSSKDRIKEAFLGVFGKKYHHEHHALANINLNIVKGESVGIVGKNGAGKSTLLKILTGVLAHSRGEFEVQGRIASLLELGAGFNPELTGRENIFFYGLLNGIDRETTAQNIDKIINFADIGEYVDQPVKTYSSGMFVRLAFSTAIHTEPEVLIIDEALSVGDAKFQRKCYNKISELKERKMTIILVSHDLDAVKKHCSRAILMDGGQIAMDGLPKDVIVKYFEILYPRMTADTLSGGADKGQSYSDSVLSIFPENNSEVGTYGFGGVRIDKVTMGKCTAPNVFSAGEDVRVNIDFQWKTEAVAKVISEELVDSNISMGFAVSDTAMNYIFGCNTFDSGVRIDPFLKNQQSIELSFKMPLLKPGDYFITLAVAVGNQKNHIQMKWYDGVGHINILNDRTAFGVIALEYSIRKTGAN